MAETTKTEPAAIIFGRKYSKYALPLAVVILVIFHAVGFWGLVSSGDPAYFQQLTPLNLLLTSALLFSFHRCWNASFILFAAVVFVAGFLAEAVGVHTGLLFGNYSYGDALGFKVWEVPLLIGLNWLMLVYSTGHISNYARLPWVAKAILSTLLMVLLDYFIEPVAMRYDFWNWQGGLIPVSNFIGWFILAFLLQLYFQRSRFLKQNPMAAYVFLVQLAFFVSLNIYL